MFRRLTKSGGIVVSLVSNVCAKPEMKSLIEERKEEKTVKSSEQSMNVSSESSQDDKRFLNL
jgi:hypothetical protein